MINLSPNYISKIRESKSPFPYAEQIRNEILSALLLDFCHIINGNFTLGLENNNLPDLVSDDRKFGYEITQCELNEDLGLKYVLSALKKCNYKKLDAEHFLEANHSTHPATPSDYLFLSNKDGKVLAYGPNSKPHSPYYYLDIFKLICKKKLDKLANGNYSNAKKIALVVNIFDRLKERDDAIQIFKLFNEMQEKKECTFFNLYLITSEKIYFMSKKSSLDSVDITNDLWRKCIEKTSEILSNFCTKK